MIGMSFGAFLTLLIISAIWSAIVHGAGYRVLPGVEGYFAKLVMGWIGGWIGSPVLGYWGGVVAGSNVHVIPAILGSIAAIFMQVATLRALSIVLRKPPMTTETEVRRAA
jgi:uncharacterized membrane protein YeaQ/YmgE (transglycosylase-associated protein family)